MKNNDLTLISRAIGLESRGIMDYAGEIIKTEDENVFSELVLIIEDEFKILSDLRKFLA